MTTEEILKYTYKNEKLNHFAGKKRWYEKNNLMDIYYSILQHTSFLPENSDLVERLFYIKNGIQKIVLCPVCKTNPRFYKKNKKCFSVICKSNECKSLKTSENLRDRWKNMSPAERSDNVKILIRNCKSYIKNNVSGKTFAEIYGEEVALDMKKKISYRKVNPETYKKSVATRRKNKNWHSSETRNKIASRLRTAWKEGKFLKYSESFKRARSKMSIIMKDKILSGEFTPNITNSWTKWNSYVIIKGERKKFRSGWEAIFYLSNLEMEYEKIRIPYIFKEKSHVYIVDFVDFRNKILYEVKPTSLRKEGSVVSAKENAADVWATENGYVYEIITEDWFKNNYEKINLENNQHLKDKLDRIVGNQTRIISEYEIKTPSGWSDFHSISKLKKEKIVDIELENGKKIKCSSHHLICLSDGEYYFAQDLCVGELVKVEDGVSKIITVDIKFEETVVYDVNNVKKNSEFYCNGILVHNCQFIESAEEIWVSAQPALAVGGRAVVLSTPEGVGSFFHRTWVDAEAGKNGFNPIKLRWTRHPDRDEEWKKEQLLGMDAKKFAQEFDCDFSMSGNNVVDNETLEKYIKLCIDPIERRGEGLNLWIFKRPQEGRKYVTVADVARGDGEDWSAFHIFDLETTEQVAEFEHKVDTKTYGDILVNISTEYNDALLVIENNNMGWATIQRVIDRHYKNLFYMSSDIHYVDVEEQITNRFYSEDKKMVAGFFTSPRTRPLIITKLEEYFRTGAVKINSKRIINQLKTFIWHNGKAQASKGYNDDLVMSCAIGLWVRDTALVLHNKRNDITKSLLGGITRLGGNSSKGTGGIYLPGKTNSNPWETKIGGITEDLRWLIR